MNTHASGQKSLHAAGGPGDRGRLLVAVDVDGTLLDTEFEDVLRSREVEAVRSVRSAGHVCVLCTGRNSLSLGRVLASAGGDLAHMPLILLNGAVVIGGEPRRRLLQRTLDRATVQRLVALFRAHGAVAMVYDTEDRGGTLYHEDRPANSVLSRYLARRLETVGAVVAVDDLALIAPESALEVGTIDRHERIEALTEEIRREFSAAVRVVNTETLLARDAYCWAEVYHRDCGKGQGALLLAREYGIQPRDIVAVGDNYNDLDLFEVAGFSVAMRNAPQAVRNAADAIAPAVTESGAAFILERIAAGELPPRRQT
jgi:Cof subfamily protein (haloacid dehalogenase superfamily)